MSISTYSGTSTGAAGVTTNSFPGASNANPLSTALAQAASDLSKFSPAQFFAAYGISSTEQSLYLNANGTGLNNNAVYLVWYKSLTQGERQQWQNDMVTTGQLSATDANGLDNSAALSAFKSLIGTTSIQGTDPITYLTQNATGINGIQNQISAGLTKAQEAAQNPVTVTQTNPNTLAADITNAFDQALGYAPSATQVQAFIDQIHGQETSYAEAGRTEAQSLINQAHSEESALNKLGPNGIDTVIQAYQAAVAGTKMPGAGTVQGPVNGAEPLPGAANTLRPGTALPPGNAISYGANGQQIGMSLLPTQEQTTTMGAPGIAGQIGNFLAHGLTQSAQVPVTTTVDAFRGMKTVPFAPAGTPNTQPTYGGLYALSPADWKKAQADYAPAKKYATAGQAPQAIQQGALSALLTSAYDANGQSWSKAVESVASGSPLGKSVGTHLSAMAQNITTEVNNQISALQAQVNNSDVTVKVTAPDTSGAYSAEAAAAAKQADPTGYYAANVASWSSILNDMLAGSPTLYDQSTADTFTGPVAAASATPTTPSPGLGTTSGVTR